MYHHFDFFFFFSILIKIFWPTEHCAFFKKASMHMHSWSYIHKYTKYFHLISVKLESKCMICQVHLFQVNDGMTMKGSIEQWSCWLCLWRDLNLEPHNQKSGMHSNTAMAILPSGDYFVFCCFFFFFFFFFLLFFRFKGPVNNRSVMLSCLLERRRKKKSVGTYQKHFSEAPLMSIHNIHF